MTPTPFVSGSELQLHVIQLILNYIKQQSIIDSRSPCAIISTLSTKCNCLHRSGFDATCLFSDLASYKLSVRGDKQLIATFEHPVSNQWFVNTCHELITMLSNK